MITRQTHAFLLMFMFQAQGEPSTARTKPTGVVATTKNTNGINLLNLSKSFCHPSIHPIHLSYRSIHSFHQFVSSIHLSSIHPSTILPFIPFIPFIHSFILFIYWPHPSFPWSFYPFHLLFPSTLLSTYSSIHHLSIHPLHSCHPSTHSIIHLIIHIGKSNMLDSSLTFFSALTSISLKIIVIGTQRFLSWFLVI